MIDQVVRWARKKIELSSEDYRIEETHGLSDFIIVHPARSDHHRHLTHQHTPTLYSNMLHARERETKSERKKNIGFMRIPQDSGQ